MEVSNTEMADNEAEGAIGSLYYHACMAMIDFYL